MSGSTPWSPTGAPWSEDLQQQRLSFLLRSWLSGYTLPPADHPLFSVESANFEILRHFLAVLAVAALPDSSDPVTALRQHLPDHPAFPLHGMPSEALRLIGVARGHGPAAELQRRLLQGFDGRQAAMVLALSGNA